MKRSKMLMVGLALGVAGLSILIAAWVQTPLQRKLVFLLACAVMCALEIWAYMGINESEGKGTLFVLSVGLSGALVVLSYMCLR